MSATPPNAGLIPPYGGRLVNLIVSGEEAEALRLHAQSLPSLQISDRSACDLELLAVGGFSPLDRFMGAADHERVVREMRLADGTLFPMPIILPVDASPDIQVGAEIVLRSSKNELLAVMTIDEVFDWDAEDVSRRSSERRTCVIHWSQKCAAGVRSRSVGQCGFSSFRLATTSAICA